MGRSRIPIARTRALNATPNARSLSRMRYFGEFSHGNLWRGTLPIASGSPQSTDIDGHSGARSRTCQTAHFMRPKDYRASDRKAALNVFDCEVAWENRSEQWRPRTSSRQPSSRGHKGRRGKSRSATNSETRANLLIGNGTNFRDFWECALVQEEDSGAGRHSQWSASLPSSDPE